MAYKLGVSTTKGTRSSTMWKELFGELYQKQSEFECNKSQTGAQIIDRIFYLCSVKPGKQNIYITFDQEASKIVSDELHHDWNRKNIYPLDECTMCKNNAWMPKFP